jgi:hypothetical protein
MSLAAGRKSDPGRVLLIAILTVGWNGSTRIAVVAVLRDGTELLCGASDFKVFYLDDGALIRGTYPCPQDSCIKCERLKIDSKGAGGPGELAPSLLCIGNRGDQCSSNQKRDQAHMTSKRICQKRGPEQLHGARVLSRTVALAGSRPGPTRARTPCRPILVDLPR